MRSYSAIRLISLPTHFVPDHSITKSTRQSVTAYQYPLDLTCPPLTTFRIDYPASHNTTSSCTTYRAYMNATGIIRPYPTKPFIELSSTTPLHVRKPIVSRVGRLTTTVGCFAKGVLAVLLEKAWYCTSTAVLETVYGTPRRSSSSWAEPQFLCTDTVPGRTMCRFAVLTLARLCCHSLLLLHISSHSPRHGHKRTYVHTDSPNFRNDRQRDLSNPKETKRFVGKASPRPNNTCTRTAGTIIQQSNP